MSADDSVEPPFDDVAVTHTAKSKGFRYLDEPSLRRHVRDPEVVYYQPVRERWLVPVDRPRTGPKLNHEFVERIVIVVDLNEADTAVVVTQTGEHDHYEWNRYEEVPAVGVAPEELLAEDDGE